MYVVCGVVCEMYLIWVLCSVCNVFDVCVCLCGVWFSVFDVFDVCVCGVWCRVCDVVDACVCGVDFLCV